MILSGIVSESDEAISIRVPCPLRDIDVGTSENGGSQAPIELPITG
jgi:hypothetical protein